MTVFWYGIALLGVECLQLYRRPQLYVNLTNMLDSMTAMGFIINSISSIFYYPIAHALGGEGNYDLKQVGFQKADFINKAVFSVTVLFSTAKLIRYFGVYREFRKLSTSLFSIMSDMIPYIILITIFLLCFTNIFKTLELFESRE